jgi:hypothetical protein
MPYKNDRTVLSVDDAFGDGDVVGQRRCRVLNDADFVAVVLEYVVDAFPTGAVDETSVNKPDILGSMLVPLSAPVP